MHQIPTYLLMAERISGYPFVHLWIAPEKFGAPYAEVGRMLSGFLRQMPPEINRTYNRDLYRWEVAENYARLVVSYVLTEFKKTGVHVKYKGAATFSSTVFASLADLTAAVLDDQAKMEGPDASEERGAQEASPTLAPGATVANGLAEQVKEILAEAFNHIDEMGWFDTQRVRAAQLATEWLVLGALKLHG